MLILNDVLIDEDIFLQKFVCDIKKCCGICCIEGTSGAPLSEDELDDLEKNYPAAKEYLAKKNIESVEKQGLSVIDPDGDLVTPLVDNAECAFVSYKEGIAMCSFERAFLEGKTTWRKPASCWLYPIRVSKIGPYKALKFHRWGVCKAAFANGRKLGVPCYEFLREPISDFFSEEFYKELCEVAKAFLKQVK